MKQTAVLLKIKHQAHTAAKTIQNVYFANGLETVQKREYSLKTSKEVS